MFFAFPGEARWNGEQEALEFTVGIGAYQGVIRVPREAFRSLLGHAATPSQCVEAYYRERTAFELAAEEKLRARLLTAEGDVEITGRDLRRSRAAVLAEEDGQGV